MDEDRLVELYFQKLPSSPVSEKQLRTQIAFLLEYGLTGEQLFFTINYGSKYYPRESSVNLSELFLQRKDEILKYYEIAKAKRDRKALKESEESYDSKNKNKGTDTPSWLRKSFDKHLFE